MIRSSQSFLESEKYTKRSEQTIYVLLCYICLFCLASCSPPTPQREFTGDKVFRTTQPSKLFFANTRAHSYYRKRPQGSNLDVYRLRKFKHTRKQPKLVPIIVDAYLKDEAYLFIEANDFPGIDDQLTFYSQSDQGTDTFKLEIPSRKAQLAFATDLYEGVMKGHKLGVAIRDTGYIEILTSRAERAAFQTVVKDYYRLTEKI